MGNAHGKEVADDNTGMTQRECRLLHDTWHGFCSANHEGGVLIFSAFLTQNPSLLTLFRRFRVMPLAMLPSDPAFRAHACTVAYQVTSMVDNAGDPVLVEALIRKNAILHTTKAGVYPHHFDVLGRVLMEVMVRRDDKKQITPAAVTAWRKLLEFMLRITNDVYTEAGIQFVKPGLKPSSLSDTTSEDSMSAFETCLSGMSNTSEVTGDELMKTAASNICSPGTSASSRTSTARTSATAVGRTGSDQRLKGRAKEAKQRPRPLPAPSASQINPSQSKARNETKREEASNNPPTPDKPICRPAALFASKTSNASFQATTDEWDKVGANVPASIPKDIHVSVQISEVSKSTTLQEFQELGLLPSGPKINKEQVVGNTSETLLADTAERPNDVQKITSAKLDPLSPRLSSESAEASQSERAKPDTPATTGAVNGVSRALPATTEGQKEEQPSSAKK